MNLRVIGLFFTGLLLASCAGSVPPLQSSSDLTVVSDRALPAPALQDQSSSARAYLIGPFDKLKIDVFGIKEMSGREVQVDASGRVSFPLIGSFEAAGKTPFQIEDEIESRLRQSFVRDPQVTVNLEETVSQVVTIDGQVAKPGLYPVLGQMSLMQTIATSGGLSEFAKLDDIVVFRNSGGQRYAALYNLGAIRRGVYEDPDIYAGDVVIVGDSNSRRLFHDVLAASPLLVAPIIAILQNSRSN